MSTIEPSIRIPELVAGDRLTRAEFERRYSAMPGLKKAELIEGVVYVPSPVRHSQHSQPHFVLEGWLSHYVAATPGVDGGDNGTVRLDLENEPQPDVFLRIPTAAGGRSRIDAEGYIEGAPELVGEITASSASYDLHDKLRAYRRNGVQEYLVWRTLDGVVDWFALREGRYEPIAPGADGLLRSGVFPGLWLDPAALLARDLRALVAALAPGLASPEHAAFLDRLAPGGP